MSIKHQKPPNLTLVASAVSSGGRSGAGAKSRRCSLVRTAVAWPDRTADRARRAPDSQNHPKMSEEKLRNSRDVVPGASQNRELG